MMKKIVRITIDNYKAYLERQSIEMPEGENLLIYGENGSGKSSLYNAMKHFLRSSVDRTATFDKNVFSEKADGLIELLFRDYDDSKKCTLHGTEMTCASYNNPDISSNTHSFIKLSNRQSGFLDYSQLLKVYLNNESQPNIFELVNELIGDFVPTSYGYAESIKDILGGIRRDLSHSYRRADKSYTVGKAKFVSFASFYANIIDDLDVKFSSLMSKYFPQFKIDLHLSDVAISLNEKCRIRDTHIEGCIHIEVKHHGLLLNGYNSRLNEARLSAIAICLYLASLQMMNQNAELKLLYLDDIFVGLDSANRRPILKIIDNEFADYQVIISTYDKSWFQLAKEFLQKSRRWKFVEFYEGEINLGGLKVVKPIIMESSSYIDKAKAYLFNNENPDYPASANYMRKAFEELLLKKMYAPAIKDNNLDNTPGYKIPKLIERSKKFLQTLENEQQVSVIIRLLDQLISNLRPMLHPLSHYAPGEPVYKQELMDALNIYDELTSAIEAADYGSRIKPIATRDSHLKFVIKGNDWEQEYKLHVDYDLYRYEDKTGTTRISKSPVSAVEIRERNLTTNKESSKHITNSTKNKDQFKYESIYDCVSKITAHLQSPAENKIDYQLLTPVTDMFLLPKLVKTPVPRIVYSVMMTRKL